MSTDSKDGEVFTVSSAQLEQLEKDVAQDLEQKAFVQWLLSNAYNPIWKKRTPEQEIARLVFVVIKAKIKEIQT